MRTTVVYLFVFVLASSLRAESPSLPEPDTGVNIYESPTAPKAECEIDRMVFAKLASLGIQPTLCSDCVFVRRAYVDVIGTLPSAQEARDFINDPDAVNKRRHLIDRLLARPEFAVYWAMKWSDILRIKAEFPVNLWPNAAQAYHRWVLASLQTNKPYDKFAREMLTSSGSNFRVGPVNFYRAIQNKTPEGIATAVALTFMGTRTDSWPKERFDGMVAFFSQVGYKPSREWKEEIVFWDPLNANAWAAKVAAEGEAAKASLAPPPAPPAPKPTPVSPTPVEPPKPPASPAATPETAKPPGSPPAAPAPTPPKPADPPKPQDPPKPDAKPAPEVIKVPTRMVSHDAIFPDGTKIQLPADKDPRDVFADWLITPKNPWFTRNIANRLWSWLLGRGIIHEPDDIRDDNPPANPELLAWLEKELVAHQYDTKHLFLTILNSQTYQLSAISKGDAAVAEANFGCYPLRRLDAEVLIDAINKITGTNDLYTSPIPEPFTYIPKDMSAVAIADGSITSSFLALFGRSARATGMEDERINKLLPAQWLHLLNSSHIQRKIETSPTLKAIIDPGRKPQEIIDEIYLTILSRLPTPEEVANVQAYGKPGQVKRREEWIDLIWSLLNNTEFLYRH